MKNAVKKICLLILILNFQMWTCTAQSALLKGRIYSADDFTNISHANVVIKNAEGLVLTSITTGYDGRYQTDSIEAGAYLLEITSKDFEPLEMNNIYLQAGKVANIDIAMDTATQISSHEPEEENRDKKPGILDVLGGILKSQIAGGF